MFANLSLEEIGLFSVGSKSSSLKIFKLFKKTSLNSNHSLTYTISSGNNLVQKLLVFSEWPGKETYFYFYLRKTK